MLFMQRLELRVSCSRSYANVEIALQAFEDFCIGNSLGSKEAFGAANTNCFIPMDTFLRLGEGLTNALTLPIT